MEPAHPEQRLKKWIGRDLYMHMKSLKQRLLLEQKQLEWQFTDQLQLRLLASSSTALKSLYIEGVELDDGYETFLECFSTSMENRGRGSTSVERVVPQARLARGQVVVEQEMYSPPVEEEEEQTAYKTRLLEIYRTVRASNWPTLEIDEKMHKSYALQRQDILNYATVNEIDDEDEESEDNPQGVRQIAVIRRHWPFLFETKWQARHFQQLIGTTIDTAIQDFTTNYSEMLMDYLTSCGSEKAMAAMITITTMVIRVEDGKREGTYVYHCEDGFYYHFNNGNDYGQNEGNATLLHLRCVKRYKRSCMGTAKIEVTDDGAVWTNMGRHSCAPNPTRHQVMHLRQDILVESVENFNRPYEAPAALVERVRARYPVNVAVQVPPTRMRAAIYRSQNSLYPLVPRSLNELGNVFNDPQWHHLTSSLDGTDNLFSGVVNSPDGGTGIVFVSRRCRRVLRRMRTVFCDGTFGSRPGQPHSAQVLQIVAVINGAVTPLVQVLLSSKSQLLYEATLRHIQRLVPGFRPNCVMTDFETALQNAWKAVFPRCQVYGCYWHYCRAVLLKARALGLTQLMRDNRVLRSLVRASLALPLLPAGLIDRGLRTLILEAQRSGHFPVLEPFFTYWVETWGNPRFFRYLSVYGLKHRTNNVAESANRLLRSKTGAHRPGLWHFLSALRRHEHSTYLKLMSAELGLRANRSRRVSAINNDRKIRNYQGQMFQGEISINKFLHLASTRVLRVFDVIILNA
ncbi:uncharacterized protein LOC117652054 [Thrips palmi]|uniref:Uncharacterized protein LOC117652054 n=1 Tax=Thrips palmi TaxID=161013 RepID=A0A6P9A5R4_THRPL|nr:uncharacterized protein LOC117652054 [Thrips palmi]